MPDALFGGTADTGVLVGDTWALGVLFVTEMRPDSRGASDRGIRSTKFPEPASPAGSDS